VRQARSPRVRNVAPAQEPMAVRQSGLPYSTTGPGGAPALPSDVSHTPAPGHWRVSGGFSFPVREENKTGRAARSPIPPPFPFMRARVLTTGHPFA
jgi:hypothetical protein